MEPSNATGTGPHTTFIAKPAFYWLRSLVHLFQDAFQCMIGWEHSCTFTVISWSGRQPLNHGALAYFFKCIFPFLEENLAAECNVNIKIICSTYLLLTHISTYWCNILFTGPAFISPISLLNFIKSPMLQKGMVITLYIFQYGYFHCPSVVNRHILLSAFVIQLSVWILHWWYVDPYYIRTQLTHWNLDYRG